MEWRDADDARLVAAWAVARLTGTRPAAKLRPGGVRPRKWRAMDAGDVAPRLAANGARDSAAEALEELRAKSLRYLLLLCAVVHFAWNTLVTATAPQDLAVRAWLLFPLAVGGELATYRLLERWPRCAGWTFVLSGFVWATAATWLFQAPEAAFVYPLFVLVASVVLGPSVGLLVAFAGLAPLAFLAGPAGLLDVPGAARVAAASLGTAAVAWTFMHSLATAVDWSLNSYEQARRAMREAQEHRGRLVQALRQLDTAYYRLQRANAALAEAWRAASAAERAKVELATSISHELRTPLNLIVGFSEMMVAAPETYGAEPLPREYRGDLHAIYRSAQHLLALTNDVLDLAQADAHRLVLVTAPTDLAAVVRDAAAIVREYVEAKGLFLRVEAAAELRAVPLDGLRVRQVLLNLLTNAARFTERGGITVAVERAADEALVSVADTGRGIPADELGRVFESFHHLDEEAARAHTSTGVGLALSRRFVELHRGRMWVESAVGRGTTFRFTLPLRSPAGEPVCEGAGEAAAPSRRRERVLVLARQDQALQRLLQRHLADCDVLTAADLDEAVGLAQELRASAVLADLDAPDRPDCPTPLIRCPLDGREQPIGGARVLDRLAKPVTRAALGAALARAGPAQRLLLVDDDMRAVRLLGRMVRACGYAGELLTAHNGQEALDLLRSRRPDLVLLDVVMPVLGGREVLERMAADPALAPTPVIVVSGQGPQDDRLPLAGELRLSKPDGLQIGELVALIDASLSALRPPRAYLAPVVEQP
jgi:signal transduction histidine kinase/CheY-like chemotaxis protein